MMQLWTPHWVFLWLMYFCVTLKNNGYLGVLLIINLSQIKDILTALSYYFYLNYKRESFQDTWIPNIELFFTVEREANNSLAFFDLNFFWDTEKLHASVYTNVIFSGILIDCESFWPIFCKCHLISTLLHRGLMICSSYRTLYEKS